MASNKLTRVLPDFIRSPLGIAAACMLKYTTESARLWKAGELASWLAASRLRCACHLHRLSAVTSPSIGYQLRRQGRFALPHLRSSPAREGHSHRPEAARRHRTQRRLRRLGYDLPHVQQLHTCRWGAKP